MTRAHSFIVLPVVYTSSTTKRSSFASVEALEQRIAQFIDYYNENLAKPFRWKYDGKAIVY